MKKTFSEVQSRIIELYFEYMEVRDRLISEASYIEVAQVEADAWYVSKREDALQAFGWDLIGYLAAQREEDSLLGCSEG